MRVLVTGASGFIGSALVPALVSANHDVRVQDLSGCDALVHLANIAHASADRAQLWRVNVEGTRRIAEAAAAAGLRRMVYLSSIKASGERTGGRPFDATEAPQPEDAYGEAKLAAERALAEVVACSGLEVIILRPPLVYGPGVKANFLALMSAVARRVPLPFASIENRRSLVYIGNLVQAIARCLEAPGTGLRTYTVGDGTSLSTPELCRAMGRALGTPAVLFRFPPSLLARLPRGRRLTDSLEVDDARVRRELGWQPSFSLQDALGATVRWYRAR